VLPLCGCLTQVWLYFEIHKFKSSSSSTPRVPILTLSGTCHVEDRASRATPWQGPSPKSPLAGRSSTWLLVAVVTRPETAGLSTTLCPEPWQRCPGYTCLLSGKEMLESHYMFFNLTCNIIYEEDNIQCSVLFCSVLLTCIILLLCNYHMTVVYLSYYIWRQCTLYTS